MRCYLTLCAMGLAFGALVCLVVANRMLMALDDAHSRARAGLEEETPAIPAFYKREVVKA